MSREGATTTRILGIDFFHGSAAEAVDRMSGGGLLVVPAAPALRSLEEDAEYREALLQADLTITDSAYMVLIWNRLTGQRIRRLSGLEYLRELLSRPQTRRRGRTVWVMANQASADRNVIWLRQQGVDLCDECVYVAPYYGRPVDDPRLLVLLERVRPDHVIITIGGGNQEPLGLYLKRRLSFQPAIHCIGAAIAFLSGDQVRIPGWADRLYMGWLFRSVSSPRRYVPRYWGARKLLAMLVKYRDQLPPLTA